MKKSLLYFALISIFMFGSAACKTKAKRCAQFDNADSEYKLKRDRHGRVKK